MPECVRTRLVASFEGGPVVFDRKVDTWDNIPHETYTLEGAVWRRRAYRETTEDGEKVFVVVVERVPTPSAS